MERPLMHEPQLERIRVLESRVQRWRLVSLALLLVVVSFLAIGCTFGIIAILNQGNRREIEMRRDAELALQEAQRARQEAEQALQRKKILEKNNDGP
jgi:hypothetical protein